MITVDTSKFPLHISDSIWMNMDGPSGQLYGKIKISLGKFLDILENEEVIECN